MVAKQEQKPKDSIKSREIPFPAPINKPEYATHSL